jgi:hypothetical protein
MKFLDTYKIFEYKTDKYLYHGSPYVFEKFKERHTFFSESKDFSLNYGNTKSFEQGLDNETNIYTVKVKCDFFNIHDGNDERKLRNALPDKIRYSYNNFGFSTEEEKDEMILNMKGFMSVPAYKPAIDAKVGDTIPGRDYEKDVYKIFKKDKKYAYAYDVKNFDYDIAPGKIMKSYQDVYKSVKSFINSYIEIHRKEIQGYYNDYVKADIINSFLDNNFKMYPKPSEEKVKEFNSLYKDMVDTLLGERIKKGYFKKFNIVDIKEKLIDTWRFYENDTVTKAIIELGYGGYISQENKKKTYVVFDPTKDVEIVKYEIPEGREFDSWEDYTQYKEYDKKLYNYIQSVDEDTKKLLLSHYNKWDLYRFYKNEKTIKEYINFISKTSK